MREKILETTPNPSSTCLIVGNYCHDVLIKDNTILTESLGGATSFISSVIDGLPSFTSPTFISKVGPDFSYSVSHPPIISQNSKTTLFHAHFSSSSKSQPQTCDRILKRVNTCEPIFPSDLPDSPRFHFGLAVGVAGEILPQTLSKMVDICDTVFVDVQALIRVFDKTDGTVNLVHLKDSGFYDLIPRIGFLKASSDEAPYVDVEEVRWKCCVVVTNGEEGCTVYYRNLEMRIAPFETVQVDPTGAGDSFLGGLVVGIAQGLAVPDAALLGNFFGSLTVGQLGLPKFDSGMLQTVKNELHRKRLQSFGCHEKRNNNLVFLKPLDHEEFLTTLVSAKTIPAVTTQECQQELPTSPKVVQQCNNIPCNGQHKLFSSTASEETIKLSGDGMP